MVRGSSAGDSFAASEQRLHEEAIAEVGADDFGDPSYLEGLRVILDAYDNEARFSPAGREAARGQLVQTLAKRLQSRRLLARHREVLANEIERPVIVLGLVRTGSTALHHLLGRDPDIQVLEYWLAANPRPRPARETWESEPDFRAAAAEIQAMYDADPSLKAIHLMMADGPEECRHFLAQNFTDDYYEVNATVPSYTAWYEAKQLDATYRQHRDLLKLVGSTSPAKRWILKYPVHMKNLGALLEVYPDACIVQTHRDPRKVLSSYISLIAGFRALFEEDIDRDGIAREQLEVWASGAEHAIEVRRRHGSAQFFDLNFSDYVADPIAAVGRIYDHFGLELSAEAERRMRRWQDTNARGSHGAHEHSIADVGIGNAEIIDRFAEYMKHFDVPLEPC